jgi:hypothetical protein
MGAKKTCMSITRRAVLGDISSIDLPLVVAVSDERIRLFQ